MPTEDWVNKCPNCESSVREGSTHCAQGDGTCVVMPEILSPTVEISQELYAALLNVQEEALTVVLHLARPSQIEPSEHVIPKFASRLMRAVLHCADLKEQP